MYKLEDGRWIENSECLCVYQINGEECERMWICLVCTVMQLMSVAACGCGWEAGESGGVANVWGARALRRQPNKRNENNLFSNFTI